MKILVENDKLVIDGEGEVLRGLLLHEVNEIGLADRIVIRNVTIEQEEDEG
jgi:hypothetical protein